MEKIKPQFDRIISFVYKGIKIKGKVERNISAHCIIRLHKDYTSNSGKVRLEGEKCLFQIKDMEDIKLHDEY